MAGIAPHEGETAKPTARAELRASPEPSESAARGTSPARQIFPFSTYLHSMNVDSCGCGSAA
jgi:hypothetical protein